MIQKFHNSNIVKLERNQKYRYHKHPSTTLPMTDFNFLVIPTKERSANRRDFSSFLVEMTALMKLTVINPLCLIKLGELSG